MDSSYIIIRYDYDGNCDMGRWEWDYTYFEWWRCARKMWGRKSEHEIAFQKES